MRQENKKNMSKEDYRKYIAMLINMINSEEELKNIYNCANRSLIREPAN